MDFKEIYQELIPYIEGKFHHKLGNFFTSDGGVNFCCVDFICEKCQTVIILDVSIYEALNGQSLYKDRQLLFKNNIYYEYGFISNNRVFSKIKDNLTCDELLIKKIIE